MKYYAKNGIDYITDLIWQKKFATDKFNLITYATDCEFDFYCKTKKLGNTYGFGRYPKGDDGKPLVKLKKPISLALSIIEAVDIDLTQNVFICFCFDNDPKNPVYGYIFLFEGSILAEDGEFLGTLDEVKARMRTLAKNYNASGAFVPDDVPFYNNSAYEYEIGLTIQVLQSENKEIASSDYWFFNKRKSSAGAIHKLDINRNKKIVIGAILGFILLGGTYGVFEYISSNDDDDGITQIVTQAPQLPTSYPAKIFIEACMANFNKSFINDKGWQTVSYKCTNKGIEVNYKSTNDTAKIMNLQSILGQKVAFTTTDAATLKTGINLPKTLPPTKASKDSLAQQLDDLDEHAARMGFTTTLNTSTNHYSINSSYSPMFLYENNIINNLNISEIMMTPDGKGFMNWSITGEMNAK